MNWTVVGFAVGLSIAVAVTLGLVPALRAGRANAAVDLRDGPRVTGGDRLRSTFVVAEVALTVVLLTGAVLLGRSLARLIDVDKGFPRLQAVGKPGEAANGPSADPVC